MQYIWDDKEDVVDMGDILKHRMMDVAPMQALKEKLRKAGCDTSNLINSPLVGKNIDWKQRQQRPGVAYSR